MAASSSSAFFCMRHENEIRLQPQPIMPSAPAPQPPLPSNKKRRNQPGNSNPDAEIIALSPTSLMATNRFVCEVCNKGFQREQNLQLHRRGHNLPWKLKQKRTKEVTRRKVYLCPEPGCVHHHPSRALGDLTGIKKHYSRKHGEKKYMCERCARKYAVKSDWKAHSKTCGTREYPCDCGMLFSRRDSFITHRAFCDAIAQESTRNMNPPPSFTSISTHLLGLSQSNHHISDHHQPPLSNQDLLRFGGRPSSQFGTLVGSGFRPSLSQDMGHAAGMFLHQQVSGHDGNQTNPHGLLGLNNKSTSSSSSLHGLMQSPQLQINNVANFSSSSTSGVYNLGFFPGSIAVSSTDVGHLMSMASPSLYRTTSSNAIQTAAAHMSATALLQKAAQLGPTTSNAATSSLLKSLDKSHHHPPFDAHSMGVLGGGNPSNNNHHHMQDLVNSMASGASSASIFGGLYDDERIMNDEYRRFHEFDDGNQGHNGNYENPSAGGMMSELEQAGNFTRDFLGVGGIAREQYNVVEMSAMDHSISMQEKSSAASHHSQAHSLGGGIDRVLIS